MNKARFLISIIILLSGCATISPHENFKQSLNAAIGTTFFEQTQPGKLIWDRKPICEKILQNGNTEKTYFYMIRRSCIYAIEIEPKTEKIVNARIVYGAEDCFINP